MSDERATRAGSKPEEPVHTEHYCQHPGCKRWGSFGHERGRGQTEWWCGQHRPD